MDRLRMVVFVSGRGSHLMNFVKRIDAGDLKAEIMLVFSDNPSAPALKFAKDHGIRTESFKPEDCCGKKDFEERILNTISNVEFDALVLAGYMRLLSADFIKSVTKPIFNIHPSLLPSFKGLNAQKQALDYGVKITGATCHFVNEKMDGGRIISQVAIDVKVDDDEHSLSERLLPHEHELYWRTLENWRISFGK